jgi:hypothetical protein
MHNSKQPILFPQIKVGQYILEEMECEAPLYMIVNLLIRIEIIIMDCML